MNNRFSNPPSNASLNPDSPETYDGRESISGLIRGLAGDLTTLFSKEISLAKAELREAAGEVKTAVASMATGAALAMAGLVVLLQSAVYGLNNIVDLWLAALVVGLIALVLGFVLVKTAKGKVEPAAFKPERTVESVHKAKETAERAIR
jgi:VIT1/CCC1 family predicted Fe2+/Mn2+ transporter